MPAIISVGTALPPHILEQSDVKGFAHDIFGDAFHGDIDRLMGIYDNSEIERRHFCVPLDWFRTGRGFREKNDLYIRNALELSKEAIATALDRAGMTHGDIDYILFVSTTGVATPSIDARLIRDLPFRNDIKRLPIWGLGCAGGASSLSRAMDIARALPDAVILVVVVELCGLTFMRNDLSKAALIASSLFGDGAAAVVVCGDEAGADVAPGSPRLIASRTTTMEDSLDVMGWEITDAGFKIVMSRDIPTIVRTFMRESIDTFLAETGIPSDRIDHYVAHPGGAKVIQAYRESLGLDDRALRHTRDTLRDCGNISACSVLFVLERFMAELDRQRNGTEHGILCALGPGFAAELLLLRWEEQGARNQSPDDAVEANDVSRYS